MYNCNYYNIVADRRIMNLFFLESVLKYVVIKSSNLYVYFTDNWDILFESISDLQWLGSGAQGAVFSGKLKNEIVAVKKVREQKETDIRHLRKLNHPNIVQFR